MYRLAAMDLVDRGALAEAWTTAFERERTSDIGFLDTWEVCLDAARHLLGWHEDLVDVIRDTALYYGQSALLRDNRLLPETRARIMEDLVYEADEWRYLARRTPVAMESTTEEAQIWALEMAESWDPGTTVTEDPMDATTSESSIVDSERTAGTESDRSTGDHDAVSSGTDLEDSAPDNSEDQQ
jgi:hypothetical protein